MGRKMGQWEDICSLIALACLTEQSLFGPGKKPTQGDPKILCLDGTLLRVLLILKMFCSYQAQLFTRFWSGGVRAGEPGAIFLGSEGMRKWCSHSLARPRVLVFASVLRFIFLFEMPPGFSMDVPPNGNMSLFPFYNSVQLLPLKFSIFRQGKKLLFRNWKMVSLPGLCINLYTPTQLNK